MNEEKIYRIKIVNYSNIPEANNRCRDALKDDRIKELLKMNSLDCEYFEFMPTNKYFILSPDFKLVLTSMRREFFADCRFK